MALKDWEIYLQSKEDIVYKRKNGLTKLYVTQQIDEFLVEVPGFILGNGFERQAFSTRSQAIKFAKEYMRTH